MTFTDRTMLAALVALAIPVLVHLVGRRRARRIVLPTVRFAEAAHQASRAATWLRRAALLALRLAAVALLVLALAGPRIESERVPPAASAAGSNNRSPVADATAQAEPVAGAAGRTAPAPIRVLVVDAEEAGEGVHSADLVAATFSGDTNIPKQVTLAKSDEIPVQDLATADVVFWVGKQPNMFAWLIEWPDRPDLLSPQSKFLGDYLSSGGRLVWIPGSTPPTAKSVRNMPHPSIVQDARAGITLDPDGYTSDLLAAFEGGTSGDLAAPVFRRRLASLLPLEWGLTQSRVITSGPRPEPKLRWVVRFHDGSPAIAEERVGRGRVVALAFGPDPYWGDLAGRPEFVVLMHSLAEALAPKLAPKPYLAPGPKLAPKQYLAPGEYTGGTGTEAEISHDHPPVYSRGANDSRGANKAGIDLTLWFILALAVVLAAESLLAAASATRSAPASPPITKAPPV